MPEFSSFRLARIRDALVAKYGPILYEGDLLGTHGSPGDEVLASRLFICADLLLMMPIRFGSCWELAHAVRFSDVREHSGSLLRGWYTFQLTTGEHVRLDVNEFLPGAPVFRKCVTEQCARYKPSSVRERETAHSLIQNLCVACGTVWKRVNYFELTGQDECPGCGREFVRDPSVKRMAWACPAIVYWRMGWYRDAMVFACLDLMPILVAAFLLRNRYGAILTVAIQFLARFLCVSEVGGLILIRRRV